MRRILLLFAVFALCRLAVAQPLRMPPSLTFPETLGSLRPSLTGEGNTSVEPNDKPTRDAQLSPGDAPAKPFHLDLAGAAAISAIEPMLPTGQPAVARIGSFLSAPAGTIDHRIVRYDVPLTDSNTHNRLRASGIRGKLLDLPADDSSGQTVRVVRYEVPDDQILLHSEFTQQGLHGDLVEVHDSASWRPQVRFLQPKARVFFDMKRDNDAEFDLFRNGSILASLDVLEIYKPLKFVTDFFAEEDGKSMPLHALGWRFGATLGLGITTALANGGVDGGGAPIGVASVGLRYEFPIGPEPPTVLDQHGRPFRLDQRTRVGFEAGLQAGTSADETITDRIDAGFYIGMLVNTPW